MFSLEILDYDEKKNKLKLKITSLDDFYFLYNFIRKGDLVRAKTTRKVQVGGESGEQVRIPMNLTIHVDQIGFQEFAKRIRVKGKIVEGPERFVSIGSHHTINLEVNDVFELIREDGFTEEDLDLLKETQERFHGKPVVLTAISDDEATVGVLTPTGLRIVKTVYHSSPQKGFSSAKNDKEFMNVFFTKVFNIIKELLDQYNTDIVIVAGPGFTKEHFSKFLKEMNKSLTVYTDSVSNATENGLYEIIRRGIPDKIVQQHKIVEEAKAIEELLMHLGKNDGLVVLGLDRVYNAVTYGVAEKILVSFSKINSLIEEEREKLMEILKQAKIYKIKTVFISNLHPLGEQFERMGGIAAILRYKTEV